MIKLDIFSDPICPWCYIGKTHLDRALESRPNHPFTIEWHPFQLNPEMPEDGMDRRAYLEGKFGGKENAIKAYMPVAEHAEKAGLKMNLEGIKTTPNTINAHRLIHWAGIEGVQTPIVSALFKAYFIEGRDIGDIDVLADVADTGGMDAAVTRKLYSRTLTWQRCAKRMRPPATWASIRCPHSLSQANTPFQVRSPQSCGNA